MQCDSCGLTGCRLLCDNGSDSATHLYTSLHKLPDAANPCQFVSVSQLARNMNAKLNPLVVFAHLAMQSCCTCVSRAIDVCSYVRSPTHSAQSSLHSHDGNVDRRKARCTVDECTTTAEANVKTKMDRLYMLQRLIRIKLDLTDND
jgi:hypothetical protein